MPAYGFPVGSQQGECADPRGRPALLLLLSMNLFNYIDRQVLAAVEPQIRHTCSMPASTIPMPAR